MADAKLHVLIAGAGVSGLLIAQGLKKAGIEYTIFDKAPSAGYFNGRDWGMTIHWSKPLVEKLLPPELWNHLKDVSVDPSFNELDFAAPLYNAKTGQFLKTTPAPHAMRFSRKKLRQFCAQDINVQYGKTIVGFECEGSDGCVIARFADGTELKGSILIGADGHRSKVRDLLLGEEKGSLSSFPGGVQLIGMTVCYNDAEKARHVRSHAPINSAAFQGDYSLALWMAVIDIPDPDKPEDWVFQITPSWAGEEIPNQSDEEKLAMLKDMAKDFAEPWKSAFLWIPEGTPTPHSNLGFWVTIPWDNRKGAVTLAGDSAHAMPPHRGQGLNHSIQDALNVVEALKAVSQGASTLSESISAYDAELVKRGSDEVNTSVQSAIMTLNSAKLMESPLMKQGFVKSELK